MRWVLGALAALAALATLMPGAAGAYGTSTTCASQATGTPPGTWTFAPSAGCVTGSAAATLAETNAGGLPPSLYPSNSAFATGSTGWSATDHSAALCTDSSAYDAGAGNPAGSVRTSYATLLNALNLLAACDSTWTSESFTWSGGPPAAVGFSMDRKVGLNGLVGLATATWSASLVDETVPGSKVLVSGSASADSGWTTQTAAGLTPADVVSGHTYHLRIDIAFSSLLSLVSGFGVNVDNVTLSVTPYDYHAAGELWATGVPVGTTHTLEASARTTGEPFDVQVWNGSSWTTRATVTATAPSWQSISYGLTPAEWNGGTVRVRFADTAVGPDAIADTLSVDYLRVVATGGIAVSGPTSVTMPGVTIDGLSPTASSAALADVEVVDGGGSASGWTLTATATPWALDGAPAELLPAGACTVAPAAPTAPNGSDLTGLSAGAGGVLGPAPVALMSAAPGSGVGTYRQSPVLTLTVPVTAQLGVYRSQITLSAS